MLLSFFGVFFFLRVRSVLLIYYYSARAAYGDAQGRRKDLSLCMVAWVVVLLDRKEKLKIFFFIFFTTWVAFQFRFLNTLCGVCTVACVLWAVRGMGGTENVVVYFCWRTRFRWVGGFFTSF